MKLPKTQLHKIGQSGGLINRLLELLLKPGLFIIRSVLKPLAKLVFIPLGLAAASATDILLHLFIKTCLDLARGH